MLHLWLSSLALRSCIPNLGVLKEINNLAKIKNLAESFYGPRDHYLLSVCRSGLRDPQAYPL